MAKANQIFGNRHGDVLPTVSEILAKQYERKYKKAEAKDARRAVRIARFKQYVAAKKAARSTGFRLRVGGNS